MKKIVFLIIASITLGIFLGTMIVPVISGDSIYSQLEKYRTVFNTAAKNYVEEVDTDKLTEAAIRGMLNELDPHSIYISAEDMKRENEQFSGSFEGIGISFDLINDTIVVIAPIAGGPSDDLGILAGDKIVKIDGDDAVGLPRSEVPKLLKGPKGTKVSVDIYREGAEELVHFDIIRDKIPLYSVDAAFMFDGSDIGLIRVNRFAANTHRELDSAIRLLKGQGMNKLVLDLRNNPGGYLNQAFLMADEFLSAGDTIVYTKGRRPDFNEVYMSTNRGNFEDLPIIVMVNASSASASEIVSGAVQDLDRGLIVGETTFGKGLVQRPYSLKDGSSYRITIAKYYTPSGRSIQRPYKDKDKSEYYNLVGRLDLEEGANIEHALEKMKGKIKDDDEKLAKEGKANEIHADSIPLYQTRAGRTVVGGGGITPDFIIKNRDTLTDFAVKLRMSRITNEFVTNVLGSGKEIAARYNNDFNNFNSGFEVTEEMYQKFRELAESKEIEWNEEEFQIDKDWLATDIKATLANVIWGYDKRIQVYFEIDKQIQKAITLFPEAERIARLK
jgi:carboxyl-terminal processing protease